MSEQKLGDILKSAKPQTPVEGVEQRKAAAQAEQAKAFGAVLEEMKAQWTAEIRRTRKNPLPVQYSNLTSAYTAFAQIERMAGGNPLSPADVNPLLMEKWAEFMGWATEQGLSVKLRHAYDEHYSDGPECFYFVSLGPAA